MELLASAGFFVFAVAVGWGAVYFIRKSRGRTWMQWTATVFAFSAGLLAVGSFIADLLNWATGLIPYSAGALLFIALVVVFVSLLDKKPDIATVVAAMGIPLIIAAGIVQIRAAGEEVGRNGREVRDTIERQAER